MRIMPTHPSWDAFQTEAWSQLVKQMRRLPYFLLISFKKCIFCKRAWYGKDKWFGFSHDVCTRKRLVADKNGTIIIPYYDPFNTREDKYTLKGFGTL